MYRRVLLTGQPLWSTLELMQITTPVGKRLECAARVIELVLASCFLILMLYTENC